MDLRKKTLVNLALAIVGITVITIVFSSVIILKNYEKIESDQVTDDVNLVINEINAELSGLKLLADTWGTSDDARAFIRGEYPDFIEKNFPRVVYSTYDINALIFTNTRGNILYSQGYNYDTKELEPVPPDLINELVSEQSPFRPRNAGDSTSGFLTISKGPAFIVSSPVRYSNFSGSPEGRVIVGKYMYGDEIEKYRLKTVPSLSVLALNSPLVTPDIRALLTEFDASTVLVRPEEGGGVAGYKIIKDAYGNGAVLVKIEKPRDVYNQGVNTVYSFILILLITGLFFGVLIYFLINKDVLSRIREMDAEFGEIESTGNISKRIRVTGDDEISHLGNSANQMLEQIEITRHALMDTEVLRASEIKYRELIEFLPQMVFEMDTNGTFTFINQIGLQSTGYTQEDIDKGLDAFRLVVPEHQSLVRKNIQRILAGENLGAMEYTILRKDGSRFQVAVYADAIVLKSVPAGVKGIVMNITEHKLAEEALRASEERLNLAIDGANLGLWDLNLVTYDVIHNRQWTEMLGFSGEEMDKPSSWWQERVHPDDAALVSKSSEDHIAGRTPYFDCIYRMKHRDGSWRWVHSQGKVVSRGTDGQPLRMIGINQNVTGQKRTEEALEKSKEFLNKIINSISDPIHVKDRQHRVILINDAACRLFNLTREEIIGKTAYELFPVKEMADMSWQKDEEVFRTGEGSVNEETNTYAPEKTLTVLVKKSLYTDTAGNQFLVGITTDITERKQVEEALLHETEFRESIISNARVWLSVIDQRGKIHIWNTAAEEISGYRAREVIGKNEIWKMLYPQKEYRKHITDTINRIIHDQKYLENFETTIRSKQGDEKVISWNTKGIPDATGQISNFIAIGVDVTDRHLAEMLRRESEGKFRTLLENVPDLILVHRNGTILYINPPVTDVMGYTHDELINKPMTDFIVPEYHPPMALAMSRRMDGKPVEPYEIEIITKSGGRRTVSVRGSLIKFAGAPAALNVLTDITERRRAEEALRETDERYRSLFDRSLDCLYIHDFMGGFIDANPSALKLLDYTRDEITDLDFASLLTPDQIPLFLNVIQEIRTTGTQKESSEYRVRRKDGAYIDVETTATLLYHHGKPYAIQGFAHDITGRIRAEEKLKKFNEELEQRVKERTEQINASLEEKVVLLREIHHRVKNNLQIVISLLNLQSRYIEDEKTRQVIQESQNRLRAMALVHEKLYQSTDIAKIDLDNYIRFLGNNLFQFYGMRGTGIMLNTQILDIHVDINTAIPIGLIINELISNSLKHAFPEKRRGEISIAVQRENTLLTILFKDDGVGIPEDFDWRNAESLGLRLVISLVEQLDGTIELDRSSGTAFTIVVNEKE